LSTIFVNFGKCKVHTEIKTSLFDKSAEKPTLFELLVHGASRDDDLSTAGVNRIPPPVYIYYVIAHELHTHKEKKYIT